MVQREPVPDKEREHHLIFGTEFVVVAVVNRQHVKIAKQTSINIVSTSM